MSVSVIDVEWYEHNREETAEKSRCTHRAEIRVPRQWCLCSCKTDGNLRAANYLLTFRASCTANPLHRGGRCYTFSFANELNTVRCFWHSHSSAGMPVCWTVRKFVGREPVRFFFLDKRGSAELLLFLFPRFSSKQLSRFMGKEFRYAHAFR